MAFPEECFESLVVTSVVNRVRISQRLTRFENCTMLSLSSVLIISLKSNKTIFHYKLKLNDGVSYLPQLGLVTRLTRFVIPSTPVSSRSGVAI